MAAQTFAVLLVEPGRTKLTRFNIELRGETLWATGPEDLAHSLARARPELVAVAAEAQVAVELADDLRRRGLASSVFLITPAGEPPLPDQQTPSSAFGPGRVPVALPSAWSAMEPAELLLHLVRAVISAQARTPVSPLTGLPGSPVLRDDVEKRLLAGDPFVFLYLDIDNFKAYNDVYGFGRGDIVIRALAKHVVDATRSHGQPTDLCVHIGGDDFAVVTSSDDYGGIAREIIAGFGGKVPDFYDEQARRREYIETPSRRGEPTRYPLMTLSIGGVNTALRPITGYLHLTELAAEVKGYAKALEGNQFVMDRRRG